MTVNILSKPSALSGGADLWVIPQLGFSIWTNKLDWYLNFQLGRAMHHNRRPISPFLHHVLLESEQNLFEIDMNSLWHGGQITMIAASELLPTRYVVSVTYEKSPEAWASAISGIWKNLQSPTLRIFMPEQLSSENFEKIWLGINDVGDAQEISLVG